MLLIHIELDDFLATCTNETDNSLCNCLNSDGYPAAMEVLEMARKIQKDSPEFKWTKLV